MPFLRAVTLLAAILFSLTGCDSGEPGKLTAREMEGPEGEAIVRHLIKTVPDLEPGVPREYCVISGRASTSMKFVERMSDLKLHFVSGDVLTVRDPDKTIVDPSTNLSPVTLQIGEIRRTGADSCEAVAGWALKKTFERSKLTLKRNGEHWEVSGSERIEGNYAPAK